MHDINNQQIPVTSYGTSMKLSAHKAYRSQAE